MRLLPAPLKHSQTHIPYLIDSASTLLFTNVQTLAMLSLSLLVALLFVLVLLVVRSALGPRPLVRAIAVFTITHIKWTAAWCAPSLCPVCAPHKVQVEMQQMRDMQKLQVEMQQMQAQPVAAGGSFSPLKNQGRRGIRRGKKSMF